MIKVKKITTLAEKESLKGEQQSLFNIEELEKRVREIVEGVKQEGDQALLEYTSLFDKVDLTSEQLRVKQSEIDEAYQIVDEEFLTAIREAKERIKAFHQKQLKNSWLDTQEDGSILGQIYRPLESAGLYVPGGTASYPSSVLMNALPAQVAGVERIVMVSPPGKNGKMNPYTLVAAQEAGVGEIYKIGGAQAIAALAYGTATIPGVDKIVGPGNIYVTLAKKFVYGTVNLDMLAGPSEVLVVADEKANPRYIAADLLSQAEHDVLASSILVTTSEKLVEEVKIELEKQLNALPRKEIAEKSLKDRGLIILVPTLDEALEMANFYAPEHLEILVEDPFACLGKIKHAGAIFLGEYSPEPVGDYIAGPNHVLPTGGTARFFSPLNVDDFMKKSSLLAFSRQGLLSLAPQAIKIAEVEGLEAHAQALRVRMGK